jgi:hypothetical protein
MSVSMHVPGAGAPSAHFGSAGAPAWAAGVG